MMISKGKEVIQMIKWIKSFFKKEIDVRGGIDNKRICTLKNK